MSAKISQPSPQIFTSDPLEQIMGKGVLDRDMGGLAYMFLNAFGDRRRMDQDTYMKGVSEANQIAGRVAQQELAAKQEQEMIKGALKLLELGQSGTSMPVLSKIIQNGSLNEGSDLNRALLQSKIAANNRDPNSGDGVQVKVDVGPGGTGFHTITGKGPNAMTNVEATRQKVIELMKSGKAASAAEAQQMLQNRNNYYGGNVPQ